MPKLATVAARKSVPRSRFKGQHHAAELDRTSKRLYNKVLPNVEVKLRVLIATHKTQGRLLFVADRPSTIGALPVRLPACQTHLKSEPLRA
jgi:hypothetical protein